MSGVESIQEVRDRLVALGISTATPGLKGDERLQELIRRLDENEASKDDGTHQEKEETIPYSVPSVANLSMSEIRSRLTMLGEVRSISCHVCSSILTMIEHQHARALWRRSKKRITQTIN
jgi:hypothetical protein